MWSEVAFECYLCLPLFCNVIEDLLYLFRSILHTSHTEVFLVQLDQCFQAKQLSSLSPVYGNLHSWSTSTSPLSLQQNRRQLKLDLEVSRKACYSSFPKMIFIWNLTNWANLNDMNSLVLPGSLYMINYEQ